MADEDLDSAYSLKSPSDNLAHYDDWAATYDSDFVKAHGYVAPREIGGIFSKRYSGSGVVLDIGAGTGILAEYLKSMTVDGIDISPGMLEQARQRNLYRHLIAADLTKSLDIADETYNGFVSSGTFTHGHVGPDCLTELLRIARPGALFCLGTIVSVFDGAGFGSAFARLVASRQITPVEFEEFQVYENADHDHKDDTAFAAVFFKR